MLRVFDAEQRVESFAAQFLVHVQHLAIRAVANRVRVNCHPGFGGLTRDVLDLFRRSRRHTAITGLTFKRFEHPRGL